MLPIKAACRTARGTLRAPYGSESALEKGCPNIAVRLTRLRISKRRLTGMGAATSVVHVSGALLASGVFGVPRDHDSPHSVDLGEGEARLTASMSSVPFASALNRTCPLPCRRVRGPTRNRRCLPAEAS